MVRAKKTPARGAVGWRVFRINDHANNAHHNFPGNSVRTSKYSWWNFVPKNLYEQFRRVSNFYFLIISVIQVSTDLSPTNRFSTILPLVGVLLISLLKEGYEDFQRYKADVKVNHYQVEVFRENTFQFIHWKELRVGDIVRVKDGTSIPADLVVLRSSSSDGICYVESSSLDGESNLKLRQALHTTQDGNALFVNPANIQGIMECENPNNRLYKFSGTMKLDHSDPEPVNNVNVVLRGMSLRNTNHVLGLVVYSGSDTKIMKNSRDTPSKRSRIDKVVNRAILIVFLTLGIMCTTGAITTVLWSERHRSHEFYLPFVDVEPLITAAETWVTALLLFNNLVPISLYVSLEIVKLFQARQIDRDPDMVHNGEPARARTSNLNEDLGVVEYVFTDKTGTLTDNRMDFKGCSVAGRMYGLRPPSGYKGEWGDEDFTAGAATGAAEMDNMIGLRTFTNSANVKHLVAPSGNLEEVSDSEETATDTEPGKKYVWHKDSGFRWKDASMLNDMVGEGEHARTLREFWTCLALCHTVVPEYKQRSEEEGGYSSQQGSHEKFDSASTPAASGVVQREHSDPGAGANPAEVTYQAASPDEAALVKAAKCFGWFFAGRRKGELTLNQMGDTKTYQVLAENSFTSERKRMSILVKCPDGKLRLYLKGADSAVLPLLAPIYNRRSSLEVPVGETEMKAAESTARFLTKLQRSKSSEQGEQPRAGLQGFQDTAWDSKVQEGSVAIRIPPHGGGASNVSTPTNRRRQRLARRSGSHSSFGKRSSSPLARIESSRSLLHAAASPHGPDDTTRVLEDHLEEFAKNGLRTLTVACREVTEAEADAWLKKYHYAANAVEHRDALLAEVADEIESNMMILGATAIEDKLQQGVPETIAALGEAGVKVWMLTGDKAETATNIGYSCKLLKADMQIIQIDAPDREGCLQELASARATLRSGKESQWNPDKVNENLALVIEGEALGFLLKKEPEDAKKRVKRHPSDSHLSAVSYMTGFEKDKEMTASTSESVDEEADDGGGRSVLDDNLDGMYSGDVHHNRSERHLLELAQQCKAVIACRVSPLQKAQIVRLVKNRSTTEPMTLAIGDGGNDVSMIQEAHVGVGISGVEGMQAVRASDFAVAQFRFLEKLLLWHGRNSYRRISLVVLYSFYKNVALVFTLFLFYFFSGNSGTALYESWVAAGWNVGWTFLPVVLAGVTDHDITLRTAMRFPSCFTASHQATDFRSQKLARWVINAVFHAIGAYFLWYAFQTCDSGTNQRGGTSGLLAAGCVLNFWMVLLVNGKLMLSQSSWEWKNLFVFIISILAWPLFVLLHASLYDWIELSSSREFLGVAVPLLSSSFFWMSLPAVITLLLLPDAATALYLRWQYPSENRIIQEWDKGYGDAESLQLLDEDLASHGIVTMRKLLQYLRQRGRFGGLSKPLTPFAPISVPAMRALEEAVPSAKAPTGTASSWHKLRFAMAQTAPDAAVFPPSTAPKRAGTRFFSVAKTAARTILSLERFRTRVGARSQQRSKAPNTGPVFKPRRPIVSLAQQQRLKSQFHRLLKRLGTLENRVLKDSGIVVQNLPRYHVDIQLPRIRRCLWGFSIRNSKRLERLYYTEFFIPRSVWIMRFTLIAAIVLTASLMGVENTAMSTVSIIVRLVMLCIGLLVLAGTFTKFFLKHFRIIVPACVVVVGLAKTFLVTSSGFYGQTLFQIALFLLVRVQFLEALGISLADFVIFLIYAAFELDVDVGSFSVFLLFILGLAAYGAYLLNRAMREQFLQGRALKNEQRRTTLLLDTLMPHHVTQRVRKEGVGKIISFDEPSVTVCFADVIKVPTVSHGEDSSRLVSLMDRIWSLFDAICLKHGVQKIETVGKTYMACAGLQGEIIHHAELCIVLGMDFIRVLKQLGRESANLQVRVGVHSGPVVSGVVGRKKPQFCLFGNTVNVASRMQSSSRAMEVHVSQDTYDLAREYFQWEPVDMEIKSLGYVTTYFVKGLSQRAKEKALEPNPPRAFRPLAISAFDGGFGVDVRRLGTRSTSQDAHTSGAALTSAGVSESAHSSPAPSRAMSPSPSVLPSASQQTAGGAVAVDVEPLPLLEDNRHTTASPRLGNSSKVMPINDEAPVRSETRQTRAFSKSISRVDPLSERKRNYTRLCFPLLYFSHSDIEKQYRNRMHSLSLLRFRRTLIFLFLYTLFRFVESSIQNSMPQDDGELELIMRVSIFATCAIAFVGSYFIRLIRRSFVLSHIALVVYLLIITLLVEAGRLSNTVGLDVMFFLLAVSSSTTLSFLYTIILFLGTLVPALIVVVIEDPSSQETYFVIATSVICGLSSFFTEYHSRKNFIELMLTKEETHYANELAFQMLPATLVKELREGRTGLADTFNGVAILYCDIVGFTKMCGELQAFDVVKMLHQLFSNFDVLTDRHNVFKVQTIGDCYVMAAGIRYEDAHLKSHGLKPFLQRDTFRQALSDSMPAMKKPPRASQFLRRGTTTADDTQTHRTEVSSSTNMEEVIESLLSLVPVDSEIERDKLVNTFIMLQVARELLEVIQDVKDPRGTGEHINMRVGIHVGDVVGGAIGTNTLRYDIWGSDVHIANLMESNGIPSRIKISDAAYDVLCQVPGLHFRADTLVEVPSLNRSVQTYLFDSSVEFDARIQAVGSDDPLDDLDSPEDFQGED